ncbi:MAG: hypothetical protein K2X69_06585, partial [Silvanigrellaceae bacterium]|nr:hypothetical protein [Silvanigrellaceae bacterium]
KKLNASFYTYKSYLPSYTDLQNYADSKKFDEYLVRIPSYDVPRPQLKKAELKSFKKEKSWSFEKGQKDKFFIAGQAGYLVQASKVEVRANAFASLDTAFFNLYNGRLINAYANVQSPGSQNGKLDARIELYGNTIFVLDELINYFKDNKDPSNDTKKDEINPFNFNKVIANETFRIEKSHRFAIGPIPVMVAIGIVGPDKITYGVETVPLQIQAYLQHNASVDGYALAAVDIIIAGVGVQGRITLIGLESKIIAGALFEFDDVPTLKLSLNGTVEFTALKGELSLVAYINILTWKWWKSFVERKEYHHKLWGYEGFKHSGTIFNYESKLTPTGFSASGNLSADDASEQLDLDKRLKRDEKIRQLEFKVNSKLHETVSSILNDLKSESNINMLRSDLIYNESQISLENSVRFYLNDLKEWSEINDEI